MHAKQIIPAYLNPAQASAYIQVPVATLVEWRTARRKGAGPAYSKAGHMIRYSVKDLDEWMARTRIDPMRAA